MNHRGEFGTVLLSVNSTIPWSEAVAALEPKFKMADGDAALEKVGQSTALLRQQVLDAFGIGLGVGLPQTSTTVSNLTSTDSQTARTISDGARSINRTTTTNESTSSSSDLKPGAAPAVPSTAHPDNALPERIDKQADVAINPYLQYKAAQSLYQAVKLFNEEIQNAAIRKGYVPHVVMLKLTPMLYRRDLPYDIHTKVSFFNKRGEAQDNLPYVIPIIATDNLERAIKSNSVEVSRQIGLALNAMVQGVGLNAGLDNMNRDLNAIEANDFNSLLTVGRLTDNSLYIRLGAANQATARYAAIAKNYDIATLVLVPKEYYKNKGEDAMMSVLSHTELRNGLSGELLTNIPDEEKLKEVDNIFRSVLKYYPPMMNAWEGKSFDDKMLAAQSLIAGIQQSDWKVFLDAASNLKLGVDPLSKIDENGFLNPLWVKLAGIIPTGAFNGASVKLRATTPLKVPLQTVTLRDYGDKGMEAVLRNVSGARKGGLTAWLKYPAGNEFPAETITIEPDTRLLRLGFASPKPWKLNPAGSKIIIRGADCDWDDACPDNKLQDEYPVAYLPIPKTPQPNLKLRQTLKVIVADKGRGGTTLFIDNLKEKKVALTVEGARIIGAKHNTGKKDIEVSKQQVVLSADGGVDLALDNLRPGMNVIAMATGLKEDSKSKKLVPTGTRKVEFKVVKAD